MINALTLFRPVRMVQTAKFRAILLRAAKLAYKSALAMVFLLAMLLVYIAGLFIRTSEKQY
jgi:hypothetical protein